MAVVLKDCILENQNQSTFTDCMGPKAIATKYLDKVSREFCPQLHYFVVFSSVSCGRGNAGQSNYGMANSVMERIIEKRYSDGLPAKAIQWGAVGEVGLVADMQEEKLDMEIGGTLQQRISSCLEEFDSLMSYEDPIVSSMVVAEKRAQGSGDIVETVMNIMCIKDIRTVAMDSTLSELGMDSLMAVEIRQALERDFELCLPPQELRSITFLKLKEISETRKAAAENSNLIVDDSHIGLKILLHNLGDEINCGTSILRLNSLDNSEIFKKCVLIIPGIEGVANSTFSKMAENLMLPTFLLQLKIDSYASSVEELSAEMFEDVYNLFKDIDEFYIVAYSFGGSVGIDMAKKLEEKKKFGKLILLDASPAFLKYLGEEQISMSNNLPLDLVYLIGTVELLFPNHSAMINEKVMQLTTFQSRVDMIAEETKELMKYSPEYFKRLLTVVYERIEMSIKYDLTRIPIISSPIYLVRPDQHSFVDIDENYELSDKTTGNFELKYIEGTHITMLENAKLNEILNHYLRQ